MPDKQLVQKGWGIKNVITIKNDHVTFHKKTLKEDLEYAVKFDELGFETIRKVDRGGNFAFYIFLPFTLLPVYKLIYGFYTAMPLPDIFGWCLGFVFFGSICFSMFMQRNKETIYLSGGSKTLELIATKPDRESVSLFIDEIHHAIRSYYKLKYTNFDDDTPYEDKISTIKWLKAVKSITDEEFEALKAIYKSANIIGFKRDIE
jgi:hypothetical protein